VNYTLIRLREPAPKEMRHRELREEPVHYNFHDHGITRSEDVAHYPESEMICFWGMGGIQWGKCPDQTIFEAIDSYLQIPGSMPFESACLNCDTPTHGTIQCQPCEYSSINSGLPLGGDDPSGD